MPRKPTRRDPYAVLGVDRDATDETVRRAYRRRAKQAHPDAGGSAEAFEELSRAHRLLTDQRARSRYDSTGEDEGREPDNVLANALELLTATIDEVLVRDDLPPTLDLRTHMKRSIDSARRDAVQIRDRAASQRAHAERLAKRWAAKPGRPELIVELCRALAAKRARIIAKAQDQIDIIDRALAILDDHTYVPQAAAEQMAMTLGRFVTTPT